MKPIEPVARKRGLPVAIALLACMTLGVAATSSAQDAADSTAVPPEAAAATADEVQEDAPLDAWTPGRQWMAVRAGYAKSTEDSSGHGAGGYAISYARMLKGLTLWKWTFFKRYSMGATFQHDLVGRFGSAGEVDLSATVDLTRHYAWAPNVHPYWGLGVGPYYRKTLRTGNDLRDVSVGWFFATGINTPLAERHLLGVDARLSRLAGKNDPPNPVFGLGSVDQETSAGRTIFRERPVTHWSIKVNYAFVY